jgi:hypothetical protein
MKTLPLLAALLLLPVAAKAQQPPDLDAAAGVYKHRFANADVQGDKYTSEDVFELVRLSPKTAYFRIHGEFYNGHECNISGIADLMPDALTYFGPLDYDKTPCVLKFTAVAKGLRLEDVGGACRTMDCGERGGFDSGADVSYPFAARRPIRYMPRLLASREYKQAVAEHEAHAVGTPAPGQ